MSVERDTRKRIYNEFLPDEPPKPDEYVDFNGLRGDSVLEALFEELDLAEKPLTRLLSGGRGVGKTTELRRLQLCFEDAGYLTLFIDADRTIDINNCDFPDVLALMALHVMTALEPGGALEPLQGYVAGARKRLEDFLRLVNPDVRIDKAEIGVGVAKLGFAMKQRRTAGENLREEIEAITTDILKAFQALVGELTSAARKAGKSGLVLVVDGLDKVIPRTVDKGVDQQERLFVQRAAQLCDVGAHLVLAAPISFCYSPKVSGFNTTAGGSASVLPTISLRGPHREAASFQSPGSRAFQEIVRRRLAHIGTDLSIFEDGALEQLVLASGGRTTMLMTLLRGALVRSADLPISVEAVETAIRVEANSYFAQLTEEHYAVLQEYREPNEQRPTTEIGMECLFYSYLYEYRDRTNWFEVNPVVRTLSRLNR